ncbi:MAG: metallophosphoesterase [Christensenellales bacterium]|jgi:predicted MPP superfamily phosphohydrolase
MPKREPDKKQASEQKRRDIRTMRDAVDEMRVYGGSEPHSPQREEKSPRPKKKRAALKKHAPWRALSTYLSGGKRTRRSRDRKLTLFGKPLSFWPMFLFGFVLLMVVVLVLNSANLTVDRQDVTLVGLPADLENYQILVLSDLNGRRFGDEQTTLLRQIESLDYDIVVCLGDMVGKDGDPRPFYELLDGLPARKQVYFICGDSDPGPFVRTVRDARAPLSELVLADWILGAMERGAIYVDAPMEILVGASSLWLTPANMYNIEAAAALVDWKDQMAQEEGGYLAGVVADRESLPFTSYRAQLSQALLDSVNAISPTDVQIALAHVPPAKGFLQAAATHTVDDGKYLPAPELTLAGHYCGGVWNLPGIGAFYISDSSKDRYGWFPAQADVSGLSAVDETQLYITRGLSTNGDVPLLPFRLLNSPEVSVVTLTATLPTSMLD